MTQEAKQLDPAYTIIPAAEEGKYPAIISSDAHSSPHPSASAPPLQADETLYITPVSPVRNTNASSAPTLFVAAPVIQPPATSLESPFMPVHAAADPHFYSNFYLSYRPDAANSNSTISAEQVAQLQRLPVAAQSLESLPPVYPAKQTKVKC